MNGLTAWRMEPVTEAAWPFALKLYAFGMDALAPIAPYFLNRRKRRGKEDPKRLRERLGFAGLQRPDGPLLWIHAASIGEAVAMLPLIDALKARYDAALLITTGTVTSARIMRDRLPEGVLHQFVPLDMPVAINRFLDHWKPDAMLFAESEIWPATVRTLDARGIPFAIVNGRMSAKSTRGWLRAPKVAKALIGRFAVIGAQSSYDGQHFRTLGAENVVTTGNLKFEVAPPPLDGESLGHLRTAIGRRPVWAALSLHPGEDETVLNAHQAIREADPNCLLLMVPRHPERAPRMAEKAHALGLKTVLRTKMSVPDSGTDAFIFDTLGEIGTVTALAPVALMGGTLIEHGGQNPIEPIRTGTVVLHGPSTSNFREVFDALAAVDGVVPVTTAKELSEAVSALLQDEDRRASVSAKAQAVIEGMRGASARTLEALQPVFARTRLREHPAPSA